MTAPYTKTIWVDDSAPAVSAANLDKIEEGIKDATDGVIALESNPGHPPVVTVSAFLALTPGDGDEVYLEVDATNGIYWHFRYRAASASSFKWEFLGGPPLEAYVDTSQGTTTTTSYQDLTTAGPSVTPPVDGDYSVEISAMVSMPGTGSGAIMSYAIGATAASDADSVEVAGAANTFFNLFRRKLKTALNGGDALTAKYKPTNAAINTFAYRRISIVPRRVSAS